MTATKKKKGMSASQLLMTLASIVVIVAGLKLGSSLFIPILLAFFIATVSFPVTKWLREHGVPRFFAVIITVLVDFIVIGGVIVSVFASLGQLQDRWKNEYSKQLIERNIELNEYSVNMMTRFGGVEEEDAQKRVSRFLSNENLKAVLEGVDSQKWVDASKAVIFGILGFLGKIFLVVLLTIFMLTEARMFARRMNSVFSSQGPNFHRVVSACRDIQKYLGIKTVVSAATGGGAYLLCYSLDVDFPELWGLLAFALNFVPAVGSIAAGIPPLLLALLTQDIQTALLVGGGYLMINAFLGNFLEPMLLGSRFGISTLVVILSVLFWGWVWGPVGMLLSIPLTMLLKVGLDNSNDFRWLAVAISKGDGDTPANEALIKKAIGEADGEVSSELETSE